MSNIIIEKYKNLYEACKKYPKITLSSKWGKSSKSYEKTKQYVKDGFVEESGGGIMAEINSYKERMEELEIEYNEFLKTKCGQEWEEHWKNEIGSDSCGDFGDYLYDFHPEMLM